MAEQLEAVILDWAGTTMDYGCYAPAVVFVKVFKERGVDITMEEARAPMGAHKKVHIRKIAEIPSVRKKWYNISEKEPTEKDVEEMFERFVPLQMACLADYADLIPGTLEALEEFRKRGLKIGSTTGYTGGMMELILSEAEKRGYAPDVSVCSTGDYAVRREGNYEFGKIVGYGENISRPRPHMCNLNAMLLDVSRNDLCVKVGDTLPDIEEGRNAGMWTIGLAMTGNEMGLNYEEVQELSLRRFGKMVGAAYNRMAEVKPNYIVNGLWDVPPIIDEINQHLKQGVGPSNLCGFSCSQEKGSKALLF